MKYISLISLAAALVFTSATFKLRDKYAIKAGYENFYLTFINKTDFKLEMYSCLYQIKMNGSYQITKDTVYLTYKEYCTLGDDDKSWVEMDSTQIESRQEFLKRYSKLIREQRDKKLTPVGMGRHSFRDADEPPLF